MPDREILHVTRVEVCGPQSLRLEFSDGLRKRVDVAPLLDRGVLLRLRDPKDFAKARLDRGFGVVCWPGDVDLAPEALHELPPEPDHGSRIARRRPTARARRAR